MKKQISPKLVSLTFGILILVFAVGFYIFAWTEPANSPPTCPSGSPGCDAPINVSANNQTFINSKILNVKTDGSGSLTVAGGLYINGLLRGYNNAIFDGRVGIGLAAPSYPLDVIGDVRFTGTLQGGNIPASRITSGVLTNARTSGTASLMANTLVLRSVQGRFAAATPEAASDVATKGYVDTLFGGGAGVNVFNGVSTCPSDYNPVPVMYYYEARTCVSLTTCTAGPGWGTQKVLLYRTDSGGVGGINDVPQCAYHTGMPVPDNMGLCEASAITKVICAHN